MNSLLALSALLLAAETNPALKPDGLVVHEWGTFTSVAREDGIPADWNALGCKNDLPPFVNDYGYRGFKWRLQGTVRMETPVLYFYSNHDVDARVRVSFPHGLITEWYPEANYQIDQTTDGAPKRLDAKLSGIDTSMSRSTGLIEWNNVKVRPGGAPAFPTGGDSSGHYYAARETDAAPLTVGTQNEKFLFYRGVGRFRIPLTARIADSDALVVENQGREEIPMIMRFENHNGHLGYVVDRYTTGKITFPTPTDSTLAQVKAELENTLVERGGLFPKEAHAMVETWRDSWFEEGSRVIYLLPQSAVESILPLQVDPTPAKTVRAFVGRIELATFETQRVLTSAIAKSDWATVERYDRFLAPMLQRIFPGNEAKINQVQQQYMSYERSRGVSCR